LLKSQGRIPKKKKAKSPDQGYIFSEESGAEAKKEESQEQRINWTSTPKSKRKKLQQGFEQENLKP